DIDSAVSSTLGSTLSSALDPGAAHCSGPQPAGRARGRAAQALVEIANQPPAPGLDLTEREREVLTPMIEGLNNTQIAGSLTVSPSTVKSHVSNILSKLGVASRTEAVTLALRNRLVT
ncbi:MAG: response regulator transcription factor, partial [Anaerolineales bacterium]|nr:response regulator transcription factor [Anaerolineales bacterium]